MREAIDPYELLGVRPGCSVDEIRQALSARVAAVHYSLDPLATQRLPQIYDAGAALLAQAADAGAATAAARAGCGCAGVLGSCGIVLLRVVCGAARRNAWCNMAHH